MTTCIIVLVSHIHKGIKYKTLNSLYFSLLEHPSLNQKSPEHLMSQSHDTISNSLIVMFVVLAVIISVCIHHYNNYYC